MILSVSLKIQLKKEQAICKYFYLILGILNIIVKNKIKQLLKLNIVRNPRHFK